MTRYGLELTVEGMGGIHSETDYREFVICEGCGSLVATVFLDRHPHPVAKDVKPRETTISIHQEIEGSAHVQFVMLLDGMSQTVEVYASCLTPAGIVEHRRVNMIIGIVS